MHSRGFTHRGHHGPHTHHFRGGPSHRGRGGTRARRGDIRAAALALLSEKPMHGYEMIKEIEERTGGVWKPSAGSIYPTLQLLEDEGLIAGEESDGKRRFVLTEDGVAAAEERSERTDTPPWDEVRSGAPPRMVQLGHSLRQLNAAVASAMRAADEDQQGKIAELLDQTRRGIYAVLSEESPDA
jgi:DNA-binding PadR family transcriptional regulator